MAPTLEMPHSSSGTRLSWENTNGELLLAIPLVIFMTPECKTLGVKDQPIFMQGLPDLGPELNG